METHAGVNWAELQARVPRERFIPDVVWRRQPERVGNELVPVDRYITPQRWTGLVETDGPVTTQVDYGHLDEDGSGWEVTSFCPGPTVTSDMLRELDPTLGDRVLEIGTGTGWNAALLAAAGAAVTTIEIDHELAQAARTRLGGAGGTTEVVIGDGEDGWPDGAPYDRLIATVGTARVLPAWIQQTRVGGRLVVPLTGEWHNPGIAVLERTPGGAVGRLGAPSSFTGLRGQAPSRLRGVDFTIPVGATRTTGVHPFELLRDRAAAVAIGQRITGITQAWSAAPGSRLGTLWFYASDSWATLSSHVGPPYEVSQAGPRQLADEVEAAYHWWIDQGRPGVDAWRVEVDLSGRQRLSLV